MSTRNSPSVPRPWCRIVRRIDSRLSSTVTYTPRRPAARFFIRMYRARDVFIDPPGPVIAMTPAFGTPPSRDVSSRATYVGMRASSGIGRGDVAANAATCSLSRRTSSRSSRSSASSSSGGLDGTLAVDDLTRAIKNSIDRTGMKEEEARAMAQHVLNFFGYSERIIDNVLEPEDRDAFYMLEDSGILTTEREETTLYDGREWRNHYWKFPEGTDSRLREAQKAKEEAEKMGSVYDDVPEDFWASRRERPEAPK